VTWSFLCRKHYRMEKDKKGLGFCDIDEESKGEHCDYHGTCRNKAYVEVYAGMDLG